MALRRLRELSEPKALRLLAWSLLTILKAEYLLRATDLTSLLKRFGGGPRLPITHVEKWPSQNGVSLDRLWRYSNFFARALLRSRHPCLLRSLTLYRHCRANGAPASIHFGIKRDADDLQGHSWVSLHGAPLFEAAEALQSYTAIYTYPEDPDNFDLNRVLGAARGLS